MGRLTAVLLAVVVAASLALGRTAPGADLPQELFAAGEDWQVVVDGLGFADGLSYDPAGNVFFADLRGPGAGVYRLAPDGTKTKLYGTGRSGTRLGPDGRLYTCGGKTLVAI